MTIRVGIAGCPGSGKSTLARSLAGSFVGQIGSVELVQEYARRYINKYGPIESIYEQMRILKKQTEWEDSIPNEVDLILTDCPIHIGWAYVMEMRKWENRKEALIVKDVFSEMNRLNYPKRYDIIFQLKPNYKTEKDGTRTDIQLTRSWMEDMDKNISSSFIVFSPKRNIIIEDIELEDKIKTCKQNIIDCFQTKNN
jgi:nicotinamide riboside kinase